MTEISQVKQKSYHKMVWGNFSHHFNLAGVFFLLIFFICILIALYFPSFFDVFLHNLFPQMCVGWSRHCTSKSITCRTNKSVWESSNFTAFCRSFLCLELYHLSLIFNNVSEILLIAGFIIYLRSKGKKFVNCLFIFIFLSYLFYSFTKLFNENSAR